MQAPIPGESLTQPPKNFNWERPADITDPDEAAIVHITRLQDEERMNAVLDILEFGELDLYTLVQGIVRGAVSNGIHSIDTGLIIAPVIHEYIKGFAEDLGVEFEEGIEDKKGKAKAQVDRAQAMAQRKLEELGFIEDSQEFVRDDIEEETSVEEVSDFEEEEPMVPKKRGLGARPNKGGEM